MGQNPHLTQGIFTRLRHHLYSARHLVGRSVLALKRLALSSIKWAWNKKFDLAVLTGGQAVEEYFWPQGQEGPKTRSDKLWQGSLQLGEYGLMGWNNADYYIKYTDDQGIERRCYAQKAPRRFEELYIGSPDAIEETPVFFDKEMFFRTICQEAGTDLLHNAVSKLLSNKFKFTNTPDSPFLKRVCYRTGNILLREGIHEGLVIPCTNFASRVRNVGLGKVLRSLLRHGRLPSPR